MSRPCRWIVPASGCSKPATSLRTVVLPAPLGPSRRHELARLHRELIPSTAMTLPKRFSTR